MDATTGALNWELLGDEPVPGTPEAVQGLADEYRRRSLLALTAAESMSVYTDAATDAWAGDTAEAFGAAVSRVGPEVSVMVDAATRAGNQLAGFAEVMRSMQSTAADVLRVAQEADDARRQAEESLEALHAEHASLDVAHQSIRLSWLAAQSDADAALAIGSPAAAALQSHAQWLRIAVNDAVNDTALVEAQIASVGSDLIAAEARLQAARADAQRLAMEFQNAAASTAAGLHPVPPYALDIFGAAVAATATTAITMRPPPAVAHPPAVAGADVRPPAAPPVTVARPGLAPPSRNPNADGPPAGAAADVARVTSILAAVRMIGGRPIPVDQVTPSLEVFRQYQRIGLQDVTARGAAMARALGFEGTIGGLGWRPTPTDHSSGLAIDLMTYDDVASGEVLAQFFREHHDELGVTYVIWNGRIASSRDDWAWRTYQHPAGRTDATAMHLDHVHVSFDPADNAYACACFGVPA